MERFSRLIYRFRLSMGGVLVGLLVLAAPAQAQTADDALRFTQRAPAFSPRMMGIGGAGTAGLEDYTAFLYNPAALAYFPHSELGGAFNAVSTTDDARFYIPGADPSTLEQDGRDYGLGNLGYVYKFPTAQGSFVIGAALNQVTTFNRTLAFEGTNASSSITDTFLPLEGNYEIGSGEQPSFFADLPLIAYNAGAIEFRPDFQDDDPNAYPFVQAVAPGEAVTQRGEIREEGRMREFNLGGAVEATENVMVGLSANLSFGRYQFDRSYTEVDQGGNTPDLYDVLLDNGELLRGFEELQVEQGFTSNLLGASLRVGLSSRLLTGLRGGLMLESPTYYSVNEEYSHQITTIFDEGGSLTYGNRADDVGSGEFDYRIITPWRLSGGLAYSIGAATVAADAEFVDWSQMELGAQSDEDYFEVDNPVNPNIRENLGTVLNTRFGLEYRFGAVSLRGGFAFQADPYTVDVQRARGEETFNRSRLFYSAGLGYRLSDRLELDVAWMQERFEDQYLPYGYFNDIAVPGEGATITPPVVEEEVTRNRFVVGLRYAF